MKKKYFLLIRIENLSIENRHRLINRCNSRKITILKEGDYFPFVTSTFELKKGIWKLKRRIEKTKVRCISGRVSQL